MAARNDYAKKTAPRRRRASAKKPLPGWTWLLAGLSIGLFIAFLLTLPDQGAAYKSTTAKQQKKTGGRADPKMAKKSGLKRETVKFDFYHILPEMEVAIPKDLVDMVKKSDTPFAQHVIQVGSFKNTADAESRLAELYCKLRYSQTMLLRYLTMGITLKS